MKAVLHAVLIFAAVTTAASLSAQINKDAYKQRSEMMKFNKKLQDAKVSKASKNRAKEDKKDGWKASGSMPLEQQYERAAVYENSFEDDMVTPKFVSGEGQSVAGVYDGAKMQALELARQTLIGSIETDITQLVDNNISNNQISSDDATTVVKTLNRSKSIMSKKLGQTIPAIERYRKLPNGNYEVYIRTFYSMDRAREISKAVLRAELEKESEDLAKKLDKMLGW